MMVKSFLAWMETAPAQERAEAVDILAQAYLHSTLGEERPQDVEAALTTVLDDPSPQVRRVLAVAFAESTMVPRHIVLAIAADEAEVSALLIARSPLLTEADLYDLATIGNGMVLSAIAMRSELSHRLCSLLIKRNKLDLALTLLKNDDAHIAEADFIDLLAKFGKEKSIQEAILARKKLPIIVRHMVVMLVSSQLGDYIAHAGFIPQTRSARLFEETVLNMTLELTARAGADLPRFITHLRQSAQLTPGLLFRSLLTGNPSMMLHSLAELAELDISRVCGVVSAKSDAALFALLRRSGVPSFLEAPIIAALRVVSAAPQPLINGTEWSLSAIRAAISACGLDAGEESLRLLALLRRYETEASRFLSRQHAQTLREIAREDFARISEQEMFDEVEEEAPMSIESAEIGYEDKYAIVPEIDSSISDQRNTPDLRSIIADWKRERNIKDHVSASSPVEQKDPNNKKEVKLRYVA